MVVDVQRPFLGGSIWLIVRTVPSSVLLAVRTLRAQDIGVRVCLYNGVPDCVKSVDVDTCGAYIVDGGGGNNIQWLGIYRMYP